MAKAKEYKVSVIAAVYNVEEYLEEMIESIIAQTIGFENVQLILVDDGSKDSSGNICDKYAMQYPDNILVVHKENGGVSSARNEGLKHIKGEYINFTDADDMLEDNALELMYAYLKENEEKIDLVAIRLKLLGEHREHALDYKFENTKLVDLEKDYNFVQLMINSTLIKKECFANRQFDIELSYGEDGQIAIDILLDKMCYGVVCESSYLYRKRSEKDSATDLKRSKVWYYIPAMERLILYSLQNAMTKKGYIPKFVQYSCMYELQWRLGVNSLVEQDVLQTEEIEKYKELILKALQYIDNKIIAEQKNLLNNYKTAVLLLKKENEEKKEIVFYPDDVRIHIGDFFKSAAASAYESSYESISVLPDKIIIEGYVRYFSELDNVDIVLKRWKDDVHNEYNAELFDKKERYSFCMDKVITKAKGFRFSINRGKMPDEIELQLCIRYKGMDIICRNICFGEFFPLSRQMESSYLYEEGMLLTYTENTLRFLRTTDGKVIKESERIFQEEILSKGEVISESERTLRNIYYNQKQEKKKEIWLINDGITKAGGNGETFFTYLNTVGKEFNIDTYFILSVDSEDYARLCKIGKVVPFESRRCKILVLLCDKIISSQEESLIFDCFSDKSYLYKDILYRQRMCFLSHDIVQGDVSKWHEQITKEILFDV